MTQVKEWRLLSYLVRRHPLPGKDPEISSMQDGGEIMNINIEWGAMGSGGSWEQGQARREAGPRAGQAFPGPAWGSLSSLQDPKV